MLVIVEDDSDEMSVMMITEESTEYVDGSDEEQHGGHDNDDVADGSAITLAARLTLLPSSFHMIHMPTSLLLSSSSSSSSSNASLLEALPRPLLVAGLHHRLRILNSSCSVSAVRAGL